MQTKLECASVIFALILWATTIFIGIFYQQELIAWAKITPFHMMLIAMVIVFLCTYIVLALQGFRACKESKDCPHAYRGLSHSRTKKRDKLR